MTKILKGYRLTFGDEAEFQAAFAKVMDRHGIRYEREYRLSAEERPDFFLPDSQTVIELKVAGSLQTIARVLHRYAKFEEVKEVILVCPKPFQLPATLYGKPVHCIGLFASMI